MARNVLILVSPTLPRGAYTTQKVIHAHVGPRTQDGFLPNRQKHGTNEARQLKFTVVLDGPLKSSNSKILARKRLSYCVENVIPCIWGNYPNLSAENMVLGHGMVAFVVTKGILGPDSSKACVHVEYPELHRRMQLADQAFLADPDSHHKPNAKHATAWQSVDSTKLDKRQIIIDACAGWHPLVQELTSNKYLDVLAGGTTTPITTISNNALQTKKQAAATVPSSCRGGSYYLAFRV